MSQTNTIYLLGRASAVRLTSTERRPNSPADQHDLLVEAATEPRLAAGSGNTLFALRLRMIPPGLSRPFGVAVPRGRGGGIEVMVLRTGGGHQPPPWCGRGG